MLINKELLDSLTEQAKASKRLRMHYDLRVSPDEQSQRMLNAMEPGMVMPIHRHRYSSETVVMLRGKAKWVFYDSEGNVTDVFIVESGGDICGLSVQQGQWHNTICLESGTIIYETKNGAYAPLQDEDILII